MFGRGVPKRLEQMNMQARVGGVKMFSQAAKSEKPKKEMPSLPQKNVLEEQLVRNLQILDDSARIVDSTLDIFKELIPD